MFKCPQCGADLLLRDCPCPKPPPLEFDGMGAPLPWNPLKLRYIVDEMQHHIPDP